MQDLVSEEEEDVSTIVEQDMEPEELQSEEPQSEELQSEELQSEELQSEELQSEELQSEEPQSEELQSEELQSEELQSEELQAEERWVEPTPPVLNRSRQVQIVSESIDEGEQTLLSWLTVERLLFGLCILLGAGMRLFALSALPLSSMEAATSWASWLAANGLDGSNSAADLLASTMPATSPLLYSLNAILFWLAGGNDALARFVPALAGTGMVVLAWYLRPHIGRWAALAFALLLAIDPWLVAYSRLADGTILTAFFGLLALIGLLNLSGVSNNSGGESLEDAHSQTNRKWRMLTAISLGLLLVSGVQAWSFIPVLLLCFWLCCDGNLQLLSSDSERDGETGFGITSLSTWLWAFAAAALLGATGWMAFPKGLSYLSTSLSGWIAQITGPDVALGSATYSLRWLWLRLVVDQPLLLIFGLIGLFLLWRNRGQDRLPQNWSLFIMLWIVWGVILVLLPGRMPTTLLLLEFPLLFAAAQVVGSLPRVDAAQNQLEWLLFVGLLAALVLSAWIMLTGLVYNSQFQMDQARIFVLIVVALIASLAAFLLWGSRQRTLQISTIFLFALLALITLSSSVQLSHRFDLQAPDAFFGEYTDSDIRALAENIEVLSSQRLGDPIQATVIAPLNGGPDPLLGWYLRKMQNLRWGAPAPTISDSDGMKGPFLISYQPNELGSVSSGEADNLSLEEEQIPDGYLGSEYGVRVRWLPSELPKYVAPDEAEESQEADEIVAVTLADRVNARWRTELRPLMRWIFYREVNPPPSPERAVLWIPVIEN